MLFSETLRAIRRHPQRRSIDDIARSIFKPDIQREMDTAIAQRWMQNESGLIVPGGLYNRKRRGSFLTGTVCELIYTNSAVFTAKASFTAEFQINDTAGDAPTAFLPAGFFPPGPAFVGKTVRITARGVAGVTGTPTWVWTNRFNPTFSPANPPTGPNVGSNAAATALSGVSAQLWEYTVDVQMVTRGAAGNNSTLRGLGMLNAPGLITPASTCSMFGAGASPGTVATFDWSLANTLTVGSTCSASSASNTIQVLQLLMFGLN